MNLKTASDTAGETSGMTLEQQIGQLFAVGFPNTAATPELLDLIQRKRVGSIILFSRNFRSREQTAALTTELQAAAQAAGHPVPLLIMTDQENGLVRRLGPDSTLLPGAMALGAVTGEAAERMDYDVARATARELLTHGITMNLAPVVDINSNPANPVIGIRSFGEQAERVARLGAAAVRGYQDAGVIATLKHFPGHGDTAIDSHLALPTVSTELERLEAVELKPFRAGIEAGASAVMIAHVGLPALDVGLDVGKMRPATLSRPIVTGLLRERLGFDGLIVSDCLEMDAIAGTVGTPRGAVGALQAGIDLVLVSHRLDRQRASLAAVRAAVAAGELSADRVRAAAERVVRLKRERALRQMAAPQALPPDVLAAHSALRDRAYALSVTVARDDAGLLPLRLAPDPELLVITCASHAISQAVDIPYSDAPLVTALRQRFPRVRSLTLRPDDPDEALAEAQQAAARADAVVLVTLNVHLDPAQARKARRIVESGPRRVIGLAACDPYDISALPEVGAFVATYEYSPPALEAAARILTGDAQAHGRLPVTLDRPAASGDTGVPVN